jgi:YD repeat-containing protein
MVPVSRFPLAALACLLSFSIATCALIGRSQDSRPSVFELPALSEAYAGLNREIAEHFAAKRYAEAERKCLDAIRLLPRVPDGHYNLACAQARLGKLEAAWTALRRAVETGYHDASWLKKDADLEPLRDDPRFADLVEEARSKTHPPVLQFQITPAVPRDGVVWVGEENTAWEPRSGVFRTFFRSPPAGTADGETAAGAGDGLGSHGDTESGTSLEDPARIAGDVPDVIVGHGEVGKLLKQWYREGTAAGNHGDFYDNHDADHSNLKYAQFPQLTRIEFDKAAQKHELHRGLQCRFLYNTATFGNSSMAMTGGPFWRSLPRLAYVNPRMLAVLEAQYRGNHLYVYPEHRDHDPGRNGKGGYGDVYCANTPYVIITQGSSGSDRVFLDALACTLAALRPQVKTALVQQRLLAPTLQMIFRSCNRQVDTPEDYLTGKAHPTVFEGGQVDAARMVQMAHAIRVDQIPPLVELRVAHEDEYVVGRDYFDVGARERLFDTHAAITRIVRSTSYRRRLVISAEGSRDVNQQPLSFHWTVLRGNAQQITIQTQNEEGSVVELIVPYHRRQPVSSESKMESNRVDIGVFAHNGHYWSAPAFVSFFYLDNEQREYDAEGRIQSVTYSDPQQGGNYVDPMIDIPKTWRDEYQYDEQGNLLGWTRHRGASSQEFTADGALVVERDESGRPLRARSVAYQAKRRGNQTSVLEQVLGDEILHYTYASPDDRLGTIERRISVDQPSDSRARDESSRIHLRR